MWVVKLISKPYSSSAAADLKTNQNAVTAEGVRACHNVYMVCQEWQTRQVAAPVGLRKVVTEKVRRAGLFNRGASRVVQGDKQA